MATAEIKARATLDNKGFQAGIAGMQQGVSRFASGQLKQLGGMIGGAFAVGAVVNFTKNMLQTADAIDNTSKQLGVGVENLQALQRETELTAGSADKMTAALQRIASSQARAVGGLKRQQEAFELLGISMDDVKRLDPAQLFERISQRVANAAPASKEAAGASRILGETYTELNTVMNTVANDGLDNLTNKMLESGQIMSDEMVRTADQIEESWNKMFKSITTTLQSWTLKAYQGISSTFAYLGALSGGASEREAFQISQEVSGMKPTQATKKAIAGVAGEEAAAEKTKAVPITQATDQLAKIGGILGAQGISTQERVARESLEMQRSMNEKLDMVAQYTKATGENTAALKEA